MPETLLWKTFQSRTRNCGPTGELTLTEVSPCAHRPALFFDQRLLSPSHSSLALLHPPSHRLVDPEEVRRVAEQGEARRAGARRPAEAPRPYQMPCPHQIPGSTPTPHSQANPPFRDPEEPRAATMRPSPADRSPAKTRARQTLRAAAVPRQAQAEVGDQQEALPHPIPPARAPIRQTILTRRRRASRSPHRLAVEARVGKAHAATPWRTAWRHGTPAHICRRRTGGACAPTRCVIAR